MIYRASFSTTVEGEKQQFRETACWSLITFPRSRRWPLPFVLYLLPRFDEHRKPLNEGSFVVQTAPPPLVSCAKDFYRSQPTRLSLFPLATPPSSVEHREYLLALVSWSSRSLAQCSRISAFATRRMKEVLGAVRCKPDRGCRPSFRRVWRTFITNSTCLLVN